MLFIDRDGSGFEVSINESTSGPTEEDISVGKRFFGGLKVVDRAYSFAPNPSPAPQFEYLYIMQRKKVLCFPHTMEGAEHERIRTRRPPSR